MTSVVQSIYLKWCCAEAVSRLIELYRGFFQIVVSGVTWILKHLYIYSLC